MTNGISCMGCHELGMIKAKDEVRKIALNGPGGKAFSRAELRERRRAVSADRQDGQPDRRRCQELRRRDVPRRSRSEPEL